MRIIQSILFIYFCIGAYLYFAQRSFLYFPTQKVDHPYPEIDYDLDGETIKVIVLNQGHKDAILYFGGNAETVAHNAPTFISAFPNHTVYLVNYRGYGGSTGKPSEASIYSDALAIFDDLKQKYNNISVLGRSLGSGVATLVASRRELKKLVLITPYDSIQAVAQKSYPIFPLSLLLRDKYNSIDRVANIKIPTLLLLADNDKVVGNSHSLKLASAFQTGVASTVVINNTEHGSISSHEQYYDLLSKFINH